MEFPDYALNRFQASRNPKARFKLCTAALSPLDQQTIFSLASDEELQRWQSLNFGYAHERGDQQLRETIAQQYDDLSADNIVTFCGTQEAIFCVMQASVRPSDHIITIDPAYEPLYKLPESIGANLSKISLSLTSRSDSPFQQWSLPLDHLLAAAAKGFQQCVINFPHNPTGCTIDRTTQQQLVDACRDQDAWLISDEVFRGLEHSPDIALPPIASIYEKGISLGSIGKPFGLGGVRIGWVACQQEELLERLVTIKRSLSICTSKADEWIATLVLNHANTLLNTTREQLNAHKKIIENDVARLDENNSTKIQWHFPEAGVIAFPSLTFKNSSLDVFGEQLLEKEGIMIIPGHCFSNNEIFQTHFRLGYGQKDFHSVWNNFVNFLNHF